MNISRGEVLEFQYSSSMAISAAEAILTIGTTNTDASNINITDLKLSCSTAAQIKLFVSSVTHQAITLDLAANTTHNFTWEIPYKIHVVASSVETKRFVASANGTGVKYSISGYIDK